MGFHLGLVIIVLAIALPILSGVLYGLLLRFGYDPLGTTSGNVNAADEPLKAAMEYKNERGSDDTDE